MKKELLLIKEEANRMLEISGINPITNKHLVVVDIQPEYSDGFKYFLNDFINFLNKNNSNLLRLTFLYNGADTLGMISESDYKNWWYENGLNENIIDTSIFYDKGYAFFRYCIDSDIPHDATSNIIRFMISKNVNDSRELDKKFWNEYVKKYGDKNVRDLLEFADDAINIPDLMDILKGYNNIMLCGGGINECFKEVEIALDALNKSYGVLTKFTY